MISDLMVNFMDEKLMNLYDLFKNMSSHVFLYKL